MSNADRKIETACNDPTFWIAERCQLLKRLYKRCKAKELCKKLGCTPSAVYHQAQRMGLNKIKTNLKKVKANGSKSNKTLKH